MKIGILEAGHAPTEVQIRLGIILKCLKTYFWPRV